MTRSSSETYSRKNPYKRAIALAIELERTHDAMTRILGHSVPLPNRILDVRAAGKNLRMNLPRKISLQDMNRLSAKHMDAILDLQDSLTVGEQRSNGSHVIGEMVHELSERIATEERYPGKGRGPSWILDPDDRMTFEEQMIRDIERAADSPQPRAEVEKPKLAFLPPAEGLERESFSIDLMTEGLLDYYRVDRNKLYEELLLYRNSLKKRQSSIILTSPSTKSNAHKAIMALGWEFPFASFRLRGSLFETLKITMPLNEEGEHGEWTYEGGNVGGTSTEFNLPVLCRDDNMPEYDIFDFPRRALRDVIPDPRFHDAIVIHTVDRHGIVSRTTPRTIIKLRRGYAHIDPPGSYQRMPVKRSSDVRLPKQARALEHRDLDWAGFIDKELKALGHHQPRTIKLKEGFGLMLSIADRHGERLVHRYEIQSDTLNDGEEAIRARLAIITKLIEATPSRRSAQKARQSILPAASETETKITHRSIDADILANNVVIPAAEGTASAGIQSITKESVLGKLCGEEIAEKYRGCVRIDALLTDILEKQPSFGDDIPDFHMQEGILAVHRMRLGPKHVYRLERFDRTMGKPTSAIGTIEVAAELPASTIEALRDGSIGKMVLEEDTEGNVYRMANRWPQFASAQVRKVTKCEGVTLVTVRVDLFEKPSDG